MADIKKKKNVKKELEKDYKSLYILLVLLLFLFIPGFFKINKVATEKVEDLIEEKIYIPSSPEIKASYEDWVKENVVYVSKDAKSRHGIAYYDYCIRDDEEFDKCEWKRTDTKNTLVSDTGIHYVVFRAVNNKDRHSKISNTVKVFIDNEAPEFDSDNLKITIYDAKLDIKVNATDKESGLDKILYSFDDNNYEVLNGTIENLKPDTSYDLYLKAVDKVGNEKKLKMSLRTVKRGAAPVDLNGDTANEEDDFIPEISLSEVPATFTYGDSYRLPSSFKFGKSGGTVECLVNGVAYTDTKDLPVGPLTITCTAKGNNGLETTVSKDINVEPVVESEEIADGWIRLNLYYPENSTVREWRLDNQDGIRTGYNSDSWEPYTGPILIRVEDIGNVYIRYELTGKKVTQVPSGKVLVDINPEKYSLDAGKTTKVTIDYDQTAVTKEYRINGGTWQAYGGTFEVTNDTIIEARAIKNVNVYDNNGDIVGTKVLSGNDTVYISTNGLPVVSMGTPGTSSSRARVGSGSASSWIPSGPGGYPTTSSGARIYPSDYLEGPVISVNPTSVVDSTTVTITTVDPARKIYYKIGYYGKYQEYTGLFNVTSNCEIFAYYIRDVDGKTSATSSYYVSNIKAKNLPYLKITTDPTDYLDSNVSSVIVSISGSNYDGDILYSLDGNIYDPYTGPITVTSSCTLYARATNQYGTTDEYRVIRTITPPVPKDVLDVIISANPDANAVQGLVGNTMITINYDSRATKKYYKLGYFGNLVEYTGPFKLTSNATIYAYAQSSNGSGSDVYKVDYLTTGISSPVIIADTSQPAPTYQIEIDYDKNAVITQFKIGQNGTWEDYNGPFYVNENTDIYAYNEDSIGNSATSMRTIKSIIKQPNYTVLDKGGYYLIKLNYPDVSDKSSRDYKWKENGTWKHYDEKGILLIKPDSASIISPDGVKITDDNGNQIIFTDNYYILDCDISELAGNIFMRWDNAVPDAPEIILDTTDSTKVVNVMINYDQSLVKRYYKTVDVLGNDSGWIEYKRPFTIDTNNVTVYARGENRIEIVSKVAKKLITNVDENPPVINVKGNFSANDPAKQKVGITVSATDDVALNVIKWAKGNKPVSYFANDGTTILNNTQFTATSNGDYTIYAMDQVGNEIVKVITVENIDLTAPKLNIIDNTSRFGIVADVEIDYEDSDLKQYSIGGNENYQNYTGALTINSSDVYNKANGDGSLTICAKGKDSAGNIAEVCDNIYSLDLDMPAAPVINANAGYPILTNYGVKYNDSLTVAYDSRNDLINYIDTGSGWKVYTGVEHVSTGTVKAKSVKPSTGLETPVVTKKIEQPGDALGVAAYDGNNNSGFGPEGSETKTYFINVDRSMIGDSFNLRWQGSTVNSAKVAAVMRFLDANNTVLETQSVPDANIVTKSYTVPEDTVKISFELHRYMNFSWCRVYEISVDNTPKFEETLVYPKLTETGIQPGYNKLNINYHLTSTTKLYKIGDGEWQNYQGTINVPFDTNIYAKGIDRYGNVTAENSYTSKSGNALTSLAYDDDDSSGCGSTINNTATKWDTYYLKVDDTMKGESIRVRWQGSTVNSGKYASTMRFYDANDTLLGSYSIPDANIVDKDYDIPEDTDYITFEVHRYMNFSWGRIYEVTVYNQPKFILEPHNPLLTTSGVVPAYNNVTIRYFNTSVQRLYKIGDGEWQTYTGPIKLNAANTIYAKGINKNGVETIVSEFYSSIPEALGPNAYDGDLTTADDTAKGTLNKYIDVDPAMIGQKISVRWYNGCQTSLRLRYYDASGTEFGNDSIFENRCKGDTDTSQLTIPDGTAKINIQTYQSQGYWYLYIYEVGAVVTRSAPKAATRSLPKVVTANPSITVNTKDYATSKNVEISYPDGYTNEYSLDMGATWIPYVGAIEVTENTTILARSIDGNGKVVLTSSYTVNKIDKDTPSIELNLEDEIPVGSDITLPTGITLTKSGASYECRVNDTVINNINELSAGEYEIICNIESKTGLKNNTSKLVKIIEEVSGE